MGQSTSEHQCGISHVKIPCKDGTKLWLFQTAIDKTVLRLLGSAFHYQGALNFGVGSRLSSVSYIFILVKMVGTLVTKQVISAFLETHTHSALVGSPPRFSRVCAGSRLTSCRLRAGWPSLGWCGHGGDRFSPRRPRLETLQQVAIPELLDGVIVSKASLGGSVQGTHGYDTERIPACFPHGEN